MWVKNYFSDISGEHMIPFDKINFIKNVGNLIEVHIDQDIIILEKVNSHIIDEYRAWLDLIMEDK